MEVKDQMSSSKTIRSHAERCVQAVARLDCAQASRRAQDTVIVVGPRIALRVGMIGILAIFVTLFGTSSQAQTNLTTYYGCLAAGGTLARVTTGTPPDCTAGQTPVSWNQTGPQGPQG